MLPGNAGNRNIRCNVRVTYFRRAIPPDSPRREVLRRFHHPGRPDRVRAPPCSNGCWRPTRRPGTPRSRSSRSRRECDALTHNIIQRLNSDVRDADRSRGHPRAGQVAGRVMDAIDAAAAVTRRYRMAQLRYGARELASLTWQSAMQVKVAVEALERKKGVHQLAVEVNRLENAADDVHDEALRRLFEEEKDAHHRHQVEGSARPARRGHRPLRGLRQRARRRRRQARIAPGGARSRHPRRRRRADLRLHQRLPRRRQLDRDRRLHPRAVARPGRDVGGVFQLRRRVRVRHRRRQDRRLRDGRHQRRDLVGDPRRPDRRDRLGPDHLVLRPADQLVARADRRLRRRRGRQGRHGRADSVRAGPRR